MTGSPGNARGRREGDTANVPRTRVSAASRGVHATGASFPAYLDPALVR